MEKEPKENNNQEEKNEIVKKEEEHPGNTNYITIDILKQKNRKINDVFLKFEKKIEEAKPCLVLKPKNLEFQLINFEESLFEFKSNFPLEDKKEYSMIYDCLNFICFSSEDEPNEKNKTRNIEKIHNINLLLKEKGTAIILLDQNYIEHFFPYFLLALGENYKTKLFINCYFIDTHNFFYIVTIQKMANSDKPINLKDLKILVTDYISYLHSKIYGSATISTINDYLKEPISKLKNYHIQCKINYSNLRVFHPGQYFQLRLKTSPLNPDISYVVTIQDYSNNVDGKNKKCAAISVSYEITQELQYVKYLSFDQMCQKLNIGRAIVLQSSILNPLGIKELAYDLSDEIQLMKPNGFNEQVPIRVWEEQNKKYLVYQDDCYLIRDNEDKLFQVRQLFYIDNRYIQNVLQSKIRVKYVSKSKVNNPPKGSIYYPMETSEKLKNKGVIQCVDTSNIAGYYEKCLLCLAYYLDLNNFPRNTVKIMDIGAGIGVLGFYYYQLFKGCCEIDNIEKNRFIFDLSNKFFGLKNYDKSGNRVNWFFEDAENCLKKMAEPDKNGKEEEKKKYENRIGFYDLIFNEVNEITLKEDTVPPKQLFSKEFLKHVKTLLKPSGIYAVNVMGRNYKAIYNNYLELENSFPSIYTIPSDSGLSYIFICFKEECNKDKYEKLYQSNRTIIDKGDAIDYSVIQLISNEVISRIVDMKDEKKKLEENSKMI